MKGNSKDVILYDITDAAIAEMKSIYMELAITDIEDKDQFDAVHSARMTVKGKRVEVEKRRKELKADALAWGKKVDGKAKDIFEKLGPIENHLEIEEKKVTDEQKRIKEEADRIEREKIDARIVELSKYGASLPFFEVAGWDAAKYGEVLSDAIAKYEAEKKRLAEEATARKSESERLEKLRLEMDEKQRLVDEANTKAAAEKASLEAEKKAFEDEKRKEQERKDRETFEKQAKEDARVAAVEAAIIQADIDPKATKKAEKDRQDNADKDAAEKARQEALKPDKEKLEAWASELLNMVRPDVKSNEALAVCGKAMHLIYAAASYINNAAKEL